MILLQLIISGILIGSVYAIISTGLSLIFGVMRIVNFMHGDFLMLAMYIAYFLYTLQDWHPYQSAIPIIIALALFGAFLYAAVIRKAIRLDNEASLMVTIGLSIILQNAALFLWSADYRSIHFPFSTASVQAGIIKISTPMLIAFVISIVITAFLFLFLHKTYIGKAIRASTADRFAATLMGVHTHRVFTITFAIGTALVGIAGVLLSPVYAVYPTLGEQFSLIAFVVVVLGGLGSLKGALVSGFIIGIVETLTSFYVSPSLNQLVYLLMFILVLIFKPAGLYGERSMKGGLDG